MTLEYLIKFPIGDWSGNGHERCDWYVVKSNKPVEELREIHFSCKEKLGFTIGNLCEEYQEYRVDAVLSEKLLELGILDVVVDGPIEALILDKNGRYIPDGTEGLLKLWLEILKYLDPTFEYEIDNEKKIPCINFYGPDSKNRHLDTPGYGLFE